MKPKNSEAMPSNNGRIYRFYLKPQDEDFINSLAVERDKSPSDTLRKILSDYKQISFIVNRTEATKK